MAERILLRLTASDPPAGEWLPVDPRGAPAGAGGDLASIPRGAAVTVLVPGTDVLLTEAAVPTRSRGRLLQALPFALEDQLAEETEHLHLAVGPILGGPVAVAVASRSALEGWLGALRQSGVEPAALVPDVLALPLAPGTWHVTVEGPQALVRTGERAGFAADRQALGTLLRLALEGTPRPPERLTVSAGDPAAIDEARTATADLVAEVEASSETGLPLLARGLGARPALDLLQGAYDRRASVTDRLRPWRWAALVAGLWVAAEGARLAVEQQRLEREAAALQTRVEAAFRRALPGAQRMVNPRVQIERALQGAAPAAGTGFLALLAASGEVLREVPGARLRGVSYRLGRLDLDLEVPDIQALDRLKQDLARRGEVEATIQTATAQDGRVQSRIQVRGAGT
ncbi:MAG: type II secretion system protein GspL [Gammaproteobacteria bacterium]|nr:type II secretion system protein GspL [Gammaproteobacteria bacterium]